MKSFDRWIDTFIEEKGIDTEYLLTVDGLLGKNYIPVGCVIEAMKEAPKHEQQAIKNMIVKIDFVNGDILHFFNHLAQAIAL
jgi:hypothetical protein